ncbi:aminoglycoside phosphotransferase family protein [Streptomyces lydicus]|nr:aminoglycoside phosphotransferase family protein [Streptomyces lydicus]
MTGDRVIKRFPREDGGRAEREWRALSLLATYAPGLAPEPREADLAACEPVVMMSPLAGAPLRGTAATGEQIEALAEAVTTLYEAVPPDVVCRFPLRPGHQGELVGHLDKWAVTVRPHAEGRVRQAMESGLDWLARSGPGADTRGQVSPVFGPGDGNLANYLWDGSRVRIVDFEDSGCSDRAFELAEITEHVGSWVEHPFDVPAFLEHFDHSPAETARLRDAGCWVLVCCSAGERGSGASDEAGARKRESVSR